MILLISYNTDGRVLFIFIQVWQILSNTTKCVLASISQVSELSPRKYFPLDTEPEDDVDSLYDDDLKIFRTVSDSFFSESARTSLTIACVILSYNRDWCSLAEKLTWRIHHRQWIQSLQRTDWDQNIVQFNNLKKIRLFWQIYDLIVSPFGSSPIYVTAGTRMYLSLDI